MEYHESVPGGRGITLKVLNQELTSEEEFHLAAVYQFPHLAYQSQAPSIDENAPITIEEAADYLRCSDSTVRNIPTYELPYHRGPGRKRLYFRSDLQAYLEARKVRDPRPVVGGIHPRDIRRSPAPGRSFDPNHAIASLRAGDER